MKHKNIHFIYVFTKSLKLNLNLINCNVIPIYVSDIPNCQFEYRNVCILTNS